MPAPGGVPHLLEAGEVEIAGNDRVEAQEASTAKKVTQSATTTFDTLVIGGIPVGQNPPPNTQIQLPLLGYVTLNEQIPGNPKNNVPLTVNALHIYVTTAGLGLPAGAELIIGHATALARPLS